jgi:raffinose/stachyose/melibiose transport system permease protein
VAPGLPADPAGAGHRQHLRRLAIWNGFLLPLILTQSPSQRTLPLALWTFQGLYSINVPAVLASVVLTILPTLALYAIGRRQLLSGLTAGFSR